MKIPGMQLYDQEAKEIHGLELQEAKMVAKATYPIAPQLDACRPLIGQGSVLNISTTKNPTEGIFSQISIVEIGLRKAGHINSLTGGYDELMRLEINEQMPAQNWSQQ